MPLPRNTRLCGARAKQNNHQPCRQPAMRDKARCRLHGGKCTGPKTPEGKKRSAKANLKHGFYTKKSLAERELMREMLKWRDDLEGLL